MLVRCPPTILVSAHHYPGLAPLARRKSDLEFLPKPIDLTGFADVVGRLLAHPQ